MGCARKRDDCGGNRQDASLGKRDRRRVPPVGVRAFNVGLDGPNDTVVAGVYGNTEKSHSGGRNLGGEFRHPTKILEGRGKPEAEGVVDGTADDYFAFFPHHDPSVVFGASTLRAC